jgi:hypothetical protein
VVPEDSIGDLRRALHITDEDSDTTCWRLVDASESVVKDPALRVRWQSSGHWHECCHHCVSESKYFALLSVCGPGPPCGLDSEMRGTESTLCRLSAPGARALV